MADDRVERCCVCRKYPVDTDSKKEYLVINNDTINRHGVYDAYCEDCYLDNIDEIKRLNSEVKCFDFNTNDTVKWKFNDEK